MRCASLILAAVGFFLLSIATASASVVNTQLSTRLPELKFEGVSFGDAIDFVRDVSGANITVNWKAVEAAGVTKDSPINLHLTAITLRKALSMILTEAAGGDSITYMVDQGVIEITTRELADHMMVTRVYPVDDLLMVIPDFTDAPQFSLDQASNAGSSGGSTPGGGVQASSGSLFQNGATGQSTEQVKTKAERAQELVELIEAVVFPDVWKDNGGSASLRYYNGMLVVTAPRAVQEAIGGEYD
jgi:hypothetical protein